MSSKISVAVVAGVIADLAEIRHRAAMLREEGVSRADVDDAITRMNRAEAAWQEALRKKREEGK